MSYDRLDQYGHAMEVDIITDKLMPKVSAIVSGSTAKRAVMITVGVDIEPTNGLTVNNDITAQLIFAQDSTPVTISLISGVVYPYSIKKVVSGTDIVGLY